MFEKSLKPYVKASTLEEKVAIINDWEEDRGAESEEYIFDLWDNVEGKMFIEMYGQRAFDIRKQKSRFWMGGNAFYCDIAEKSMFVNHETYAVTEANIDTMLSDENILGEIVDRLIDYLNCTDNDFELTASDMNSYYHNRIDFNGYMGIENKYDVIMLICW